MDAHRKERSQGQQAKPENSSSMDIMLVIPPYTYRTEAYLTAAKSLGLEVVCAIDSVLTVPLPKGTSRVLKVPFGHRTYAAQLLVDYARRKNIRAVVSIDDGGGEIAAMAAKQLGLVYNPIQAIAAANDKYLMRQMLQQQGVASPGFKVHLISENPHDISKFVDYPAVLKPIYLSGSRGVIRADDRDQFVAAFRRLKSILEQPDTGPEPKQILVEDYIAGYEVSVEGILLDGVLQTLAVYDKPDPLVGPFFEETLFITPSKMNDATKKKVIECAQQALNAVGLRTGPVQVELRVNERGPWIVELAARTMGGQCSRAMPFDGNATLEQLVLSRAAQLEESTFKLSAGSHGVMMIPIPGNGIFKGVEGISEAKLAPGVTGIMISVPENTRLQTLPEGEKYVGFIFASMDTPEQVESALRDAHQKLRFQIDQPQSTNRLDVPHDKPLSNTKSPRF